MHSFTPDPGAPQYVAVETDEERVGIFTLKGEPTWFTPEEARMISAAVYRAAGAAEANSQ